MSTRKGRLHRPVQEEEEEEEEESDHVFGGRTSKPSEEIEELLGTRTSLTAGNNKPSIGSRDWKSYGTPQVRARRYTPQSHIPKRQSTETRADVEAAVGGYQRLMGQSRVKNTVDGNMARTRTVSDDVNDRCEQVPGDDVNKEPVDQTFPEIMPGELQVLLAGVQKLSIDTEKVKEALLQFAVGKLGFPCMTEERKMLESVGHAPEEDYGLYSKINMTLGKHSLCKMEQRIVAYRHNGGTECGWLDANGLLANGTSPIKSVKERGFRRFLPDCGYLQIDTSSGSHGGVDNQERFELCIEVSRLEFMCHQLMSREDLLAAQLLSTFREYKRREAVDMMTMYSNKLEALESALLDAREQLFSQETKQDIDECLQHVLQFEREVLEMRQLYEEEGQLLERAVSGMQNTFAEISAERSNQGHALTSVGLSVTDTASASNQVSSRSRRKLDEKLLVAEEEEIVGVDLGTAIASFEACNDHPTVRRIEVACRLHSAERASTMNRLAALESQASSDPEAPEFKMLTKKLQQLGEYPVRVQLSREDQKLRKGKARELALAGKVGVYRPKLPVVELLDVPQAGQSTSDEIKGRKRMNISHCRYFVELFMNNQSVGKSNAVHLREDFSLEFDEAFRVKLARWPRQVSLRIIEKGSIRDLILAEVFLTVPGYAGTPSSNDKSIPYQWTSPHATIPKQIGEKESVDEQTVHFPHRMHLTGTLFARCGWLPRVTRPQASSWNGTIGRRLSFCIPPPQQTTTPAEMEEGWVCMPPPPKLSVDGVLRRSLCHGTSWQHNSVKVGQLLQNVGLDPNDPRNTGLLELLQWREAEQAGLTDPKTYQLSPSSNLKLQLQSYAPLKRAKFIRGRWSATGIIKEGWIPKSDLDSTVTLLSIKDAMNEGAYSESLRMIENLLQSQTSRMDDAREPLIERQGTTLRMAQGALTSALEEREERIREFVLCIRNTVSRCQGRAARKLRTDDVVRESPLPEFQFSLASIISLIRPKRKLRPSRKQVKVLQTFPTKCELVITIQRAANLPKRDLRFHNMDNRDAPHAASSEDSQNDRDEDTGFEFLSPFVEVKFQGNSKRSMAMSGVDPLFNEQIILPFNPVNGDFSPSALQGSSDMISINVFDEVIHSRTLPPASHGSHRNYSDDLHEDSQLLYPKREQFFLGSLNLPLSTIYQVGRLEGTFQIEIPPVILGYQQERSGRQSLLGIFAALKPELQRPTCSVDDARHGEADDISRHAARWVSQATAPPHCLRRHMYCMAMDTNGAQTFLSRFISPAPLPQTVQVHGDRISSETLMLHAARMVSLMPFLGDASYNLHQQDVWTTNSEFLYIAAGDHEEHANLLAGYFLELGQQAYVVLGASTAGAMSAFVLTTGQRSTDESRVPAPDTAGDTENKPPNAPVVSKSSVKPQYRLWNPLTGRCQSVLNIACDLREVRVLYDGKNVWANMQVASRPWSISWDLKNTRNWLPFFGQSFPHRDLAPLQTSVLYTELDSRVYEELEIQVEEIIRQTLYGSRKLKVSQTHKRTSRVLKRLLKELPEAVQRISESSSEVYDGQGENALRAQLISKLEEEHMQKITCEVRNQQVVSLLFSLPFCDHLEKSIQERILNSRIHCPDEESAKFAMACHVEKTGIGFVCCIWVYVVCIKTD